ncbi:hypothetical protein [Brevibacillus daliensis]|uniref:hypothetical protein n=1 Tax=Brevibacillus daliensis TaxID=2892995 RepID=UPI001E49E8FE|nr:hypothetical protein [Brevibacillus daliensis]
MDITTIVDILNELKAEDKEILLTLEASQLNILGQTFRPLFVGPIIEVNMGFVTLSPCTIKMVNAPNFVFPTPLSFPLEKVVSFTEFDSTIVFPLT